ncbi:MAG: glycosyltransferase family 1 protein [Dehalococcoidia bacterium]
MKTRVLLLRDVPEHRLLSMERLADGIEQGFDAHDRIAMRPMALHESATAKRAGLGTLDSYATRYLRYPLLAGVRRADVYHIVDHGYGHLAALLPKNRVVASCHDLVLLRAEEGEAGPRGRRSTLLRFRWSTSFLRSVARVIVPTHVTRRDAERLLGVDPARIAVVPYGVGGVFRPFDEDRRAALKREVAPGAAVAVLHVSTGGPYKNVEGVLRTIAALRSSGMPVTLIRAGAPLTAAQRSLTSQLDVADAIVDCGPVPDARLVELYNACDVLLFPSHHEGYGWPPLEAMACGTPVVASECQTLLEVCDGAALHAPAADPHALAWQVRRTIDDRDLRERLGWAGIERAAQCSWQRTIDGFASAYTAVAEQRARYMVTA